MHEVIVPHQPRIVPASHVRSTLLHSSFLNLRERGHEARWRERIGPELADEIEAAMAPAWMDMAVAQAHYRACDALSLSAAEADLSGQRVGDHVHKVLIALGARTARAAGLDPTISVRVFEKLLHRIFQGGSMYAAQTGPKDLIIELRGLCVTESRFFRDAYCGHVKAAAKFVGVRAVYVKPVRYDHDRDLFSVSLAWV